MERSCHVGYTGGFLTEHYFCTETGVQAEGHQWVCRRKCSKTDDRKAKVGYVIVELVPQGDKFKT